MAALTESSESGPSFDDLMARLRAGDDAAGREVCARYRGPLVELAARQFDTWLRDRADPEGVVQSALWSFFRRARAGFLAPDDWDEVAAILTVITVRKCGNRRKHLRAAKRDAARDQRFEPGNDPAAELPADPGPEEAVVFQDLLEHLLRGFEGRERAIVELSFQGVSQADIADRLDRPIRTVRRVVEKVRERARRLWDLEGPDGSGAGV